MYYTNEGDVVGERRGRGEERREGRGIRGKGRRKEGGMNGKRRWGDCGGGKRER